MRRLENSLLGHTKIFVILMHDLEKCSFSSAKILELTRVPFILYHTLRTPYSKVPLIGRQTSVPKESDVNGDPLQSSSFSHPRSGRVRGEFFFQASALIFSQNQYITN